MERVRTLSQARGELFALFDEVTAHAGRKIILRHRGSEQDAVLVSRDYLRRLEQVREAAAGGSFSLFGSATLKGDVEQALSAIRAEAAATFEQKIAATDDEGADRTRREAPSRQRAATRRQTTGRRKRQ